jgi:hypothetical protein
MMSASRLNDVNFEAPPVAQAIQQRSLVVGIIFAVLAVVGAFITPAQFFPAYLIGFMLWLGVTLGCLTFLMLQHLTGGNWAVPIRRILEAGTRTLWLMILFFLPIVIGISKLYPWARPAEIAHDAHLMHVAKLYLAPSYFVLRAILYFFVWAVLVSYLNRWSRLQDEPPERDFSRRFRRISAPGLVIYAFTMTFAAIDWVMSLDPHWVSTIYPLIFVVGQGLSGICFAVVAETILSRYQPMRSLLKPTTLRDHGNLMLTFVMLWAYFSFSQWLIIWAGNLPEEIRWYLPRLQHGWNGVGVFLMIFHFAVPFALLLSRNFKQNPATLARLATWLILMRWLDLLWMIEPNFHRRFFIGWLDFVVPVAIGGFWLWLFFRNLRARPLVPLQDVRIHAILESEIG